MHRRAERLLPYVTALALVGLTATSSAEQASPVAAAPGIAPVERFPDEYRIGVDANLGFGTFFEGAVSARFEQRIARHHAVTVRAAYGAVSWFETEVDDPIYTMVGGRVGYRAYLERAYVAVELGVNALRATYPAEERMQHPDLANPPWFSELALVIGIGWKLGPVDLGFEWSKATEGFGPHLGVDVVRW